MNAIAPSDPHGLFHEGMQKDQLLNGIARTGANGNYSYALLDSESADKPVTYVNFSDAVRFANWIDNGQGSASTESGAYLITTGSLVGAKRKDQITTYIAKGNLPTEVGDQAFMSGLKERIDEGLLYVNTHTGKVAPGEIRAQPEPVSQFSTNSILNTAVASPKEGSYDYPEDHCCDTLDSFAHNSFPGNYALTGMDSHDVFCCDSLDDSRYRVSGRDIIQHFNSREGLVDLHDWNSDSTQSGLQSLTWVGTCPSHGELR